MVSAPLSVATVPLSIQEAAALFQHLNKSQCPPDLLEPSPLLDGWASGAKRRSMDCVMRTISGAPSSADDLLEYLRSSCTSPCTPQIASPFSHLDGMESLAGRRDTASPPPRSSPTSFSYLRMRTRRRTSSTMQAAGLFAAARSPAASRRSSVASSVGGAASGGGCGGGAAIGRGSRVGLGGWGSVGGVPLAATSAVSRPASPTTSAQAGYLRQLLSSSFFTSSAAAEGCGRSRSCVFPSVARRLSTQTSALALAGPTCLRSSTMPSTTDQGPSGSMGN